MAKHLQIVYPEIPPPIREHEFARAKLNRKWRFDLAWPDVRLAVEVHGGEFGGGRHTSGTGLRQDSEKLRCAQWLGWTVLPFTGKECTKALIDYTCQVILAFYFGRDLPPSPWIKQR